MAGTTYKRLSIEDIKQMVHIKERNPDMPPYLYYVVIRDMEKSFSSIPEFDLTIEQYVSMKHLSKQTKDLIQNELRNKGVLTDETDKTIKEQNENSKI